MPEIQDQRNIVLYTYLCSICNACESHTVHITRYNLDGAVTIQDNRGYVWRSVKITDLTAKS